MIARGQFREDLYYRLGAVHIALLPLRQRREDVAALADHFVHRVSARLGVRRALEPATVERLLAHAWPGNARELLHCLEQALLVADGDVVRPEHLPPGLGLGRSAEVVAVVPPQTPLCTLEQVERRHIAQALASVHGHRAAAARVLGISERTLYRKVREYGL